MAHVQFLPVGSVESRYARIVVIPSRIEGKWVFVRRRGADTWEMPAGHREIGETPLQAARRELYEETGAKKYRLFPVCPYRVEADGAVGYGYLFYARIGRLGSLPPFEIEEVRLFGRLPVCLTYPALQRVFAGKIECMLQSGALPGGV